MDTKPVPQQIMALERPCPALWKYYIITAVFSGPGIIIALPYLWFRYYTLRYRFDEEGIHMRVGVQFSRRILSLFEIVRVHPL